MERFVEYASSPAFSCIVNCRDFEVSLPRITPGTQTRGPMATVMVQVRGWQDDGSEEEGQRVRWTLEEQRRPPLSGCWMVREVIAMQDWFLFNGDTGGTTTE